MSDITQIVLSGCMDRWMHIDRVCSVLVANFKPLIPIFLLSGKEFYWSSAGSRSSSQLVYMILRVERLLKIYFKKFESIIGGLFGVLLHFIFDFLLPLSLFFKISSLVSSPFVCLCMSMIVYPCPACNWCYKMSLRLLLFTKNSTQESLRE